MAETALSQINVAFETIRDGGNAPNAAYYEKTASQGTRPRRAAAQAVRCPAMERHLSFGQSEKLAILVGPIAADQYGRT